MATPPPNQPTKKLKLTSNGDTSYEPPSSDADKLDDEDAEEEVDEDGAAAAPKADLAPLQSIWDAGMCQQTEVNGMSGWQCSH